MFNDFFSSSIFHHLFGCSKIIFVLSFHNYCLPLVILNNSVHVVKWKQFFNRSWGSFFTFSSDTVFIVHITNSFFSVLNPHLVSSDSLQSSISFLWLCSEELPKPYQHFHGIHTYKLNKGVLTWKIWFSGYSLRYFL